MVKLNKGWFYLIIFPLLLSCVSATDGWKQLDLDHFKVSVPQKWDYQQEQGEDSFVGIIKISQNSFLQFDCSGMGYANHLIPTENEYLKNGEWLMNYTPFYKPGVTYTANFNVKAEKARQMKEKGTTDSTQVKVEADPSYQTKRNIHLPTAGQAKKYPQADYIADLTYKDSTIYIPITIPLEIKSENITVDTASGYITKTIWPKVATKGITGVYIKARNSNFNFNMVGAGLSEQDQDSALKAFKTITFKK